MEANERMAVKVGCAADLLQTIFTRANELAAVEKKIKRYLFQTNLLLSWKNGNAVTRMTGSSIKIVSLATVAVSAISPRFRAAMKLSKIIWRLGAGMKVLSYLANFLKEMWQNGFRAHLLEFGNQTSRLVTNIHLLEELVRDLRQSVHSHNLQHEDGHLDSSQTLWNFLSAFIPAGQQFYFYHIVCLAMNGNDYSPIFDFASLITLPSENSEGLQILYEIESLGFVEFMQHSNSHAWTAIGTLFHISRELVDFLDNLSTLRHNDCNFLRQILHKFGEELKTISSLIVFMNSLKNIQTVFNQQTPTGSVDS